MLTYAWDHPDVPTTMILISGDRDFARVTGALTLRRYPVVVIAPDSAHFSLLDQAAAVHCWCDDLFFAPGPPKSLPEIYADLPEFRDDVSPAVETEATPSGSVALSPDEQSHPIVAGDSSTTAEPQQCADNSSREEDGSACICGMPSTSTVSDYMP